MIEENGSFVEPNAEQNEVELEKMGDWEGISSESQFFVTRKAHTAKTLEPIIIVALNKSAQRMKALVMYPWMRNYEMNDLIKLRWKGIAR